MERAAQEELDLGIEAAQVVVGPALDRVQQVAVHAQEEWLPFSHNCPSYW
jgi:hypothetical protein